MANIDNWTRTRRGHRSTVTKLIYSVRTILTDFQEKDRIRLMSLQASLSDKGHLLDNLNQEILSLIEDENELGTDIDRASKVDLTIKECLFEIQAVLSKKDNNPPSSNDTLNKIASISSNSNGKLPSLNIKQFYGNPLEHQSLWESFRAAVHENDILRDITKFNYTQRDKLFLRFPEFSCPTNFDFEHRSTSFYFTCRVPYRYSIIMNKLPIKIKHQISRIMPATGESNVTRGVITRRKF